jgi:hypothetical protein
MGRPINKKHIGDGTGKIQVTAVRFAAGSEVAAATEVHIIKQRATKKFQVTDGSKTEIVTLVNTSPGSLAASQMCINVIDSDGVTKQITRLRNRTFQVEGTSNAKWARSATGTSTAVEKVITAATAASPVVVTSNGHGLANGTKVSIRGVVGMVELNVETAFTVAATATNTFALSGVNGSSYTGYTSGGVATVAALTADSIIVDAQAS